MKNYLINLYLKWKFPFIKQVKLPTKKLKVKDYTLAQEEEYPVKITIRKHFSKIIIK